MAAQAPQSVCRWHAPLASFATALDTTLAHRLYILRQAFGRRCHREACLTQENKFLAGIINHHQSLTTAHSFQ